MLDDLGTRRAARHQHRAAQPAGLLPVLRRRCVQADRRALRRRAQPLRAGAHAADAVEFPAARRAHQPPRHARQGRAADGAAGVHRHRRLRLARPLLHRQAGHAGLRSRGRPGAGLSRQLRGLPVAEERRRDASVPADALSRRGAGGRGDRQPVPRRTARLRPASGSIRSSCGR